jgi:hypothetical protein
MHAKYHHPWGPMFVGKLPLDEKSWGPWLVLNNVDFGNYYYSLPFCGQYNFWAHQTERNPKFVSTFFFCPKTLILDEIHPDP